MISKNAAYEALFKTLLTITVYELITQIKNF